MRSASKNTKDIAVGLSFKPQVNPAVFCTREEKIFSAAKIFVNNPIPDTILEVDASDRPLLCQQILSYMKDTYERLSKLDHVKDETNYPRRLQRTKEILLEMKDPIFLSLADEVQKSVFFGVGEVCAVVAPPHPEAIKAKL